MNPHSGMKVRNAFGKLYEIDLLPKEQIEKIFNGLSYQDIVLKAYEGWSHGYLDGTAEIDCSTGNLIAGSYSTDSDNIEQHYLELYRLNKNWVPEEEGCEEEEICDWADDEREIIEFKFEEELERIYENQ